VLRLDENIVGHWTAFQYRCGTRAWSPVYYLLRGRGEGLKGKNVLGYTIKSLKSVLFSMQKRGHIMISAFVKMNMKDGLK
jgi:hypothetical protein